MRVKEVYFKYMYMCDSRYMYVICDVLYVVRYYYIMYDTIIPNWFVYACMMELIVSMLENTNVSLY